MRHSKRRHILGVSSSHRSAMLGNLSVALITHGRIKTTLAKAKALRQFVEPLITIAKKGTLHSRRLVIKKIPKKDIVKILFDDIAPLFYDRPGGYTRIIKLGLRDNDRAPVSIIEFVDSKETIKTDNSEAAKSE